MAFEADVLQQVTRLRSAYAPGDPIERQAQTSEATSAAVRQLFAVVERYPDLTSQGNVLDLQAEIERLEGVIADRREHYNDTVYRHNSRIAQVPAVFLAGLFRWRPRPFFRAEPGDTVRPDTSLRAA
jgi:LemA protein